MPEYFDDLEFKGYDRLGGHLGDDISLTFANAPTIIGREGVRAQLTAIGSMVYRVPEHAERCGLPGFLRFRGRSGRSRGGWSGGLTCTNCDRNEGCGKFLWPGETGL